ncbi:MAG: glycosyltransferase, partial [Acidimicrobiales bacterium]|nr:glycosyltransferase [Acidimicrobiales bacterium]
MPAPNSPGSVPRQVTADAGLRRSRDRRTLVGGSPLRIVRLTEGGARLVERLLGDAAVPDGDRPATLVRRLLDAGIVHPCVVAPARRRTCAAVIPVRDDPAGLARSLDVVCATPGIDAVVVVDDGSTDAVAVDSTVAAAVVPTISAAVVPTGADRPTVSVLRHVMAAGPGIARDTGWRSVEADIVVFCDADVVPEPGWLGVLLAH